MLQDALNSAAQASVLLQCRAEFGVGGVAEDDKRCLHINQSSNAARCVGVLWAQARKCENET